MNGPKMFCVFLVELCAGVTTQPKLWERGGGAGIFQGGRGYKLTAHPCACMCSTCTLKGRWPRFQARAPPISFLTIEGRAAANPPPSI